MGRIFAKHLPMFGSVRNAELPINGFRTIPPPMDSALTPNILHTSAALALIVSRWENVFEILYVPIILFCLAPQFIAAFFSLVRFDYLHKALNFLETLACAVIAAALFVCDFFY